MVNLMDLKLRAQNTPFFIFCGLNSLLRWVFCFYFVCDVRVLYMVCGCVHSVCVCVRAGVCAWLCVLFAVCIHVCWLKHVNRHSPVLLVMGCGYQGCDSFPQMCHVIAGK